MRFLKNLGSLSIATAFVGIAAPAHAQVALEASSEKTYRQNGKGMKFQGGTFRLKFSDGAVSTLGLCNFIRYYPPRDFSFYCNIGTSGYLESGQLPGVDPPERYLSVTGIKGAANVEPGVADLVRLNAAPASTLVRGERSFTDESAVISYNLHTAFIEKYTITRYNSSRFYSRKQRSKFESDIVPGTYQYYFPRLGQPTVPIALLPVIYPMPEASVKGAAKIKSLRFTAINKNKWSKDGFMELSYSKPNLIKWTPFATAGLIPGSDTLTFAIRVLDKADDPKSIVREQDRITNRTQSVFPDFANSGDPKLFLRNPTTSSFTVPPILAGGTKGVVELRLQRSLQTTGVTYDNSYRRFQVPVVVVNKYSDYKDLSFPAKKKDTDILTDTDGDGFNNLNEWLLDSAADRSDSIPIAPVTKYNEPVYDLEYIGYFRRFGVSEPSYYGFTVDQKLGTEPAVVYTLQRSVDEGKTYQPFPDGYYYDNGVYSPNPIPVFDRSLDVDLLWIVKTTDYLPGVGPVKGNAPARRQIKVRTAYSFFSDFGQITQPVGTEKHLYRVKVSLKK